MTPERYQQIGKLLQAALELEPERRAAFLDEACGGDQELRREVESLISSDQQAGGFIDSPALGIASGLIDPTQTQLEVARKIAHYEILSLLGAGGMGEVYRARDTKLDRIVAIKILPAEVAADQQRMWRFVREAKTASALNHPNVAHIYEIGEYEGVSFIAMEYVEGQTLAARIGTQPLGATEITEIAIQAADALEEAHGKGITHRDLKPANMMITIRGQLKVLDFGLAKVNRSEAQEADSNLSTMMKSAPGMVMGTLPYMSPEQALGRDVDHRSDIFSLGAVLYELATARRPFSGTNASETLHLILHVQPVPINHFNPNLPDQLQQIVEKCLEKDRERRYQSAAEMLTDFRNLKRGDSITADTKRAVSRRAFRQRRSAVALAVIVLLLSALGFYLLQLPTQTIDSVAVLPFVNINADPDVEYLADGIPETIINTLSQLPNLKVMSRNSVFRFKGRDIDAHEVGRKLGVRAVLSGRVEQRGERLTINIELVNALDNSQMWGQQYDRSLADLFVLQQEISREISEKLRLKLSGSEEQQLARRPTENLNAFQFYMQGRAYAHRRTHEDLDNAIRYFNRAIEEDHNYALAYAGLADGYINLGARFYIAPLEGRRKAEVAASKAIALDENLAEAHVALGQSYIYFAPYNFLLADREWRRAIELSPSLAMAHFFLGISLMLQGRSDESLVELVKARELDPLSPIIAAGVVHHYYVKRDYGRALELLRQAGELGPLFTTIWDMEVYIQNGFLKEGIAELEKARQERKNDPILIYSTGMAYAAQNRQAEAHQSIKELAEMSPTSERHAHLIARIYASLNEKDLALTWLERGAEAGTIAAFSRDERVWDPIRNDSRFGDLLRRMGIPS